MCIIMVICNLHPFLLIFINYFINHCVIIVYMSIQGYFLTCRLSEVVQKVSKKKIPSYVKNLVFEICCDNAAGEDVEVPYIKYKFR